MGLLVIGLACLSSICTAHRLRFPQPRQQRRGVRGQRIASAFLWSVRGLFLIILAVLTASTDPFIFAAFANCAGTVLTVILVTERLAKRDFERLDKRWVVGVSVWAAGLVGAFVAEEVSVLRSGFVGTVLMMVLR